MRKVMVYEYKKLPDGTCGHVEKGAGVFLKFGIDYEELRDGVGHYSTAIVEMPDGSLTNAAVGNVRFLKD